MLNEIGRALDDIIRERSTAFMNTTDNMADQHLLYINTEGMAVQETGTNRKVYRIGPSMEDGSVNTETVFRIQGILSNVELVPGKVSHMDTSKAAKLSQKIQLVGEGSALFDQAVCNTMAIRDMFGRFFAGHRRAEWNVGLHDSQPYINASNHFFTSLADEPQAVNIPFGNGVDPLGAAAKLLLKSEGDLAHTEENVVQCFKMAQDEHNEATYYLTVPGIFKPGDIVEVHGTVMAFVNKQSVVKFHFHLQTITLLEANFSKAAESARIQNLVKITRQPVQLRRRYPYEQEDAEVTGARKKFRAMTLRSREGADEDM